MEKSKLETFILAVYFTAAFAKICFSTYVLWICHGPFEIESTRCSASIACPTSGALWRKSRCSFDRSKLIRAFHCDPQPIVIASPNEDALKFQKTEIFLKFKFNSKIICWYQIDISNCSLCEFLFFRRTHQAHTEDRRSDRVSVRLVSLLVSITQTPKLIIESLSVMDIVQAVACLLCFSLHEAMNLPRVNLIKIGFSNPV